MCARRLALLAVTVLLWGVSSVAAGGGIPTITWDAGGDGTLWGDNDNWNPATQPTDAHNTILPGGLGSPQTIDLGGTVREVRLLDVTGGGNSNYTLDNGTLEIYLTGGNSIVTRNGGSAITVEADVVFPSTSTGPRFNVEPTAEPIVVNGNITTSASSGTGTGNDGGTSTGIISTTVLEITSRNLSLPSSVTINGDITDSSSRPLGLTAGFGPDSENHRGTVRVTGNNTYRGPTIVNGATLEFDSIGNVDAGGIASALGAPRNAADGTIRLGAVDTSSNAQVTGTLRYIGSGTFSSDRNFELIGAGGVIDASGAGFNSGRLLLSGDISAATSGLKVLELNGNLRDTILSGAISDGMGTVEVKVDGPNTSLSLTGTNDYTGKTSIALGLLAVDTLADAGQASSLGAPTGANATIELGSFAVGFGGLEYIGTGDSTNRAVQLTGNTNIDADGTGPVEFTANDFVVVSAGTLILRGSNTDANTIHSNIPNPAAGNLSLNKSSSATWVLRGDNTYGGGTLVSNGRLVVDADSLPAAGGVQNESELEFDQNGAFGIYAGVISGSGTLIKSGNAAVVLSATNSYSGDTIINEGQLNIVEITDAGMASGIGTGPTVFLGGGGGRLAYTGNGASTNREFVVTPGTGQPRIVSQLGELTLTGTISGDGGAFMEFQGDIEITGTNTYSATTNLQTNANVSIPAITNAGVAGPLGTGDTIFFSTNATLHFTGATGETDREIFLTASPKIFEAMDVTGGELVLNGPIVNGADSSTLIKQGAGVLTVTAANTYANDTIVQAGTLAVNNTTGSGTGTGDVTLTGSLGNIARLSGNGTISGNVQVNEFATLDPGTSTGTLTVGGDFSLSELSEFVAEIAGRNAGEFDVLDVGGIAVVDGFLTVDLDGGFIPATADEFTIVTAGTLSGEFAGLLTGSRVLTNSGIGTFFVDLNFDDNVVTLSDFQLTDQGLGDYNGDFVVNAADYTVWRDNLGQAVTLPNDITPGTVDEHDYTVWKNNFGNSPQGAGSSPTPEPSTLVLLVIALGTRIVTNRR